MSWIETVRRAFARVTGRQFAAGGIASAAAAWGEAAHKYDPITMPPSLIPLQEGTCRIPPGAFVFHIDVPPRRLLNYESVKLPKIIFPDIPGIVRATDLDRWADDGGAIGKN